MLKNIIWFFPFALLGCCDCPPSPCSVTVPPVVTNPPSVSSTLPPTNIPSISTQNQNNTSNYQSSLLTNQPIIQENKEDPLSFISASCPQLDNLYKEETKIEPLADSNFKDLALDLYKKDKLNVFIYELNQCFYKTKYSNYKQELIEKYMVKLNKSDVEFNFVENCTEVAKDLVDKRRENTINSTNTDLSPLEKMYTECLNQQKNR
jgi:hypothetical protein